ncbi:hypothetical protein [Paenibacillus sp. RC84]|uniref:hypothetical protein n=1 Tax=Paenibacillus sp. RC84 TaxID=3156252 RepID=UPI003514F832
MVKELDQIQQIVEKVLSLEGEAWAVLADLSEWLEKEAVKLPDLIQDARRQLQGGSNERNSTI